MRWSFVGKKILSITLGLLAMSLMSACQSTSSQSRHIMTDNHSNLAETYTKLAWEYLQIGRIDDAKRQLDLAIKANARHAPAHRILAQVYQATGEPKHAQLAKSHYQQALSLDNKDMQTHYDYGVYLTAWQDYVSALTHFEQAAGEIGFDGRLAAIENIAYIRNILWESQPTKANLDLAVLAFDRAIKAGSLNADLLSQALYLNIQKDKYTQNNPNE